MEYSKKEEFWNCLTHGIGAVLSVAALVLMICFSAISNSVLAIVSTTIYGSALVILYTASTVYHAICNPKWKKIFKKIDHLSIYILIAGTYTPVCLLGLKGAWGWTLFGIVWSLTILGFFFKLSSYHKKEKLSLLLYAVMGWLVIIAAKPLIESLSINALLYLLIGGLLYTFGIFFYANNKIRFNHTIWHLFVLGGSIMHFFCVFFYMIP